ncbi:SGNH/GDSL hydrolase family protein [Vagococcus vulneris]|nr:GDSL-type esterase/lipase family protein [Vagococcus vulneris]
MRKIILFGDSITAGYYDGEMTLKLNDQIQRYFPDVEVINAGIPGDTTRRALARVQQHVIKYHPDVVTVFFGANDAADGSGIDEHEYRENLQTIIQDIGANKIVLVGPPLVRRIQHEDDRPFRRLNEYNGIAKELAILNQIPFVDLFSQMQEQINLDNLWQADGLHFSNQGYLLLGRLLASELRKRS